MSTPPITLPQSLADAVARARDAAPTPAGALAALKLLDLTNLDEDAPPGAIDALCERAVMGPAPVAAVCVYPGWVPRARAHLAGTPVRVAAVANFPDADAAPDMVARSVAEAVAAGAQEIDLVMPHAAVRAGDTGTAAGIVTAGRRATDTDTCLKVIVESGAFDQAEALRTACRVAIDNGADFLKTSTGKAAPGASLEAAAILLDAATPAGRPVGVKVSGGIQTVADAARFLALAGDLIFAGRSAANAPAADRFSPAGFRIGASRLFDDLLAVLAEAEAAS